MIRPTARAVAVAMVLAGNAGAQSVPPGTCFDITLGPWQTDLELDSLVYAVPPRIQVGDSTGVNPRAGSVRREFGVPEGGLPTPHALTGWQEYSRDSIRAFWSTGFVGVRATLRLTDQGFRGEARTFSDLAGDPGIPAGIAGTRVPCLPLDWRLEDQRPLLRSILLADGQDLTLMEPVGTVGMAVPHRPGIWRFDGEVAPPFDGVSHGYLSTGHSDRPHRVRLWYDDPAAFARLEHALRAELGEPVYVRAPGRWLRWENRTTYVSLFGSPAHSEGAVSLILMDRRAR